jgi:Ca2+-binding RTX toxin-like protein
VVAGNGNDHVQLGARLPPAPPWMPSPVIGDNFVELGNGNDQVQVGDGDNTVIVGGGNDQIQAGDGNNVIVAGGGNDNIQAGNGDNLIVGGGGQDHIQAGNGNNILIDGSVAQSTEQIWGVLDQWIADIKAGDAASKIAGDLSGLASAITYNATNANTLDAGRGFDAFFATYAGDHLNAKSGDLLNGSVVPPSRRGH